MSNQSHESKIHTIQRQLKTYYKEGKKVKIYHGTTNSIRKQTFKRNEIVDISNLNQILKVDTKNKLVVTEPNVSMDTLVRYTLKHKLIPSIVMEFKGITVGGGIQGGATESSAFKYAGFHDICTEYEILLGNGERIIASSSENKELFEQIACSYGTLGIITKVTLKLIKACAFVKLQYQRTTSFQQTHELLLKNTHKRFDFIDGILWSSRLGVIMNGKMTNKIDSPKVSFHSLWDDWFYIHAEQITKQHNVYEEIIPIYDYLFRYDRGAFWMARYAFSFMHIPFNHVTRLLLNWFCSTTNLYRQLHASNLSQRFIIQDFCIPKDNVITFLKFVDKQILCYPLWLLPINASVTTQNIFTPLSNITDLIINVGIWTEITDFKKFLTFNRLLENTAHTLDGKKTLYAHAYYSEEKFWQIYNKKEYNKLRIKYKAVRTFPNIYKKISVKEKYIPSLRTALRSLFSFKLPMQ